MLGKESVEAWVNYYKDTFNRAGWFIPSYSNMRFISKVAKAINESEIPNIEPFLEELYSSLNLAAMVTGRYPIVPHINEYQEIISESIEAHFLGLHHVAVTGLMPVVEGVGLLLVDRWKVDLKDPNNKKRKGISRLFSDLAEKCRLYA